MADILAVQVPATITEAEVALLLLQTEAMVTETIRQRGDWVQAVAEVDIDLRGLRELPVELANFEFSTENMIGGKFCGGKI